MEYAVEERFQIPYIRLKFILVLSEDSILPKEKVSALRGGMGEMLLRQNCIGMRDCKNCSFEEACIVRSTVYTRMKRKPAFMQGDDSIGYLWSVRMRGQISRQGKRKFWRTRRLI